MIRDEREIFKKNPSWEKYLPKERTYKVQFFTDVAPNKTVVEEVYNGTDYNKADKVFAEYKQMMKDNASLFFLIR